MVDTNATICSPISRQDLINQKFQSNASFKLALLTLNFKSRFITSNLMLLRKVQSSNVRESKLLNTVSTVQVCSRQSGRSSNLVETKLRESSVRDTRAKCKALFSLRRHYTGHINCQSSRARRRRAATARRSRSTRAASSLQRSCGK